MKPLHLFQVAAIGSMLNGKAPKGQGDFIDQQVINKVGLPYGPVGCNHKRTGC